MPSSQANLCFQADGLSRVTRPALDLEVGSLFPESCESLMETRGQEEEEGRKGVERQPANSHSRPITRSII